MRTCPEGGQAPLENPKPFAVFITKLDGKRRVEFNRYATLAQAQIDAAALRRHGIDARATNLDALQLEHRGQALFAPEKPV